MDKPISKEGIYKEGKKNKLVGSLNFSKSDHKK